MRAIWLRTSFASRPECESPIALFLLDSLRGNRYALGKVCWMSTPLIGRVVQVSIDHGRSVCESSGYHKFVGGNWPARSVLPGSTLSATDGFRWESTLWTRNRTHAL